MTKIKDRHLQARSAGFNLLEVMVVVAILGITALIAVPNMSRMVENSQLRSTVNAFTTALALARDEAISSGNGFVVARIPDGGGAQDFVNGWCVAQTNGCGNPVRVFNPLTGQAVGQNAVFIQFNNRGELVAVGAAPEITFQANSCDEGTEDGARTVTVQPNGRVVVGTGDCV